MADGNGGGGGKPPIISNPDLHKPLIFANHQRGFKIFNYLVAAGIAYYGVFVYKWPGDRHCFSWIREYKEEKKRQFFYIDPTDPELQHIREQTTSKDNSRT